LHAASLDGAEGMLPQAVPAQKSRRDKRRSRSGKRRPRVPELSAAAMESAMEGNDNASSTDQRKGTAGIFIPQSAYPTDRWPMETDDEDRLGGQALERCLICHSRSTLLLCFGKRDANMLTGAAEQAHTVCRSCLNRWFSAHNELRASVGLLPHSRHSCPVCRCLLRGSSLRSKKYCLGLLKVRKTWPDGDTADEEDEDEGNDVHDEGPVASADHAQMLEHVEEYAQVRLTRNGAEGSGHTM